MQISAFSQSSYPKRILWGNDTVLAINKEQLISINRALNNYNHLQKVHKNLQVELLIMDSMVVSLRNINSMEVKKSLLTEEKYLKQVKISEELHKTLLREKKQKIKKSICVGAGGTLIGVVIGMLLIK